MNIHSQPLYRTAGLRAIEAAAADQPLMQRAGLAAAERAAALCREGAPVLVLAGPGNNGGDAFEAALQLRQRFFDVRLVFAGAADKLPADAAAAQRRFLAAGGEALPHIPRDVCWGLIVDGLFGIGLQRDIDGFYAELIAAANALAACNACPLLALDCPSGLDGDTGRIRGSAIRATHTLTFIALKPGLLTADGPDHCGQLALATLDAPALATPEGLTLGRERFASQLRPRRKNSHKGSHGNAAILGGAPGMVGAAFIAGRAAQRLGAGRVYLGLLDPQAPAFDPQQPELMRRDPNSLFASQATVLACGPGMGSSPAALNLLEQACTEDVPLLLDADALNLVAAEGNLQVALASRRAPSLLTPHPAEAARLLGTTTAEVQNERVAAALELASRYRAHVALKGCGTIIATPDSRWFVNTTGNPGMASAGMGDVLTGIVAALLAQGWPAEAALAGAVHLHGAAADALVAAGVGPIGLCAGETIDAARALLNRWVADA